MVLRWLESGRCRARFDLTPSTADRSSSRSPAAPSRGDICSNLPPEEALVERTRYIFRQGAKECLIDCPTAWPGVCSVRARLHGEKLIGVWYDETGIYEKSRREEKVDRKK